MFSKGTLRAVTLAASLFVYTCFTGCGNAADAQPELLARISTRSVNALVANLDAFVAACVKDTPAAQQYQPGMLGMIIPAFSPLPVAGVDMKAGMHVGVVASGGGKGDEVPPPPEFVFVIKTTGNAGFQELLKKNGFAVQGGKDGFTARTPKIAQPLYFAPLDNDRMAFSTNAAACTLAVKNASIWPVTPAGEADIVTDLDMNRLREAYGDRFGKGMENMQFLIDNPQYAEKRSKLENALTRAFTKALVKLSGAKEWQSLAPDRMRIDLSFASRGLKAAAFVHAKKGSAIDRMRASYAGKDLPPFTLAQALPAGANLAAGKRIPADFPIDTLQPYTVFLREFTAEILPDKAEAIASLPSAFLGLGITESASGMYLADDRMVSVAYFTCEKPGEVMALLTKSVDLGSAFVNACVKLANEGGENAPAVQVRFNADAGKVDGMGYGTLVVSLAEGGQTVTGGAYIGVEGKTVIAVFGSSVKEGDLTAARKNLLDRKNGFMQSPAAKEAVGQLKYGQIAVMAARPIAAIVNMRLGQAALADKETLAEAKQAAKEIKSGLACMAIGFGADADAMVSELLLPSAVVSDFIRNGNALNHLSSVVDGVRGSVTSDEEDEDEVEESDVDEGEIEEEAFLEEVDEPDQPEADVSVPEQITNEIAEQTDSPAPASAPDASEAEGNATLLLEKKEYGPDDELVVTLTGISKGTADNRPLLAIFAAGAPYREYGEYTYPSQGDSTARFRLPDDGSYELRLYDRDADDATVVAMVSFTVVGAAKPATLRLDKREYRPGSEIKVMVAGVTGRMEQNSAFVAIYQAGAPHGEYGAYQYLSKGDNTKAFTAPEKVGDYEMRLYRKDGDYSDESLLITIPFGVKGK